MTETKPVTTDEVAPMLDTARATLAWIALCVERGDVDSAARFAELLPSHLSTPTG